MSTLAASALLSTIFASGGAAQPAVFSPTMEKGCILDWFSMGPTSKLSDLSKAYNDTPAMRLAAIMNMCGASAGSSAKPCDEMCATEIQVLTELRSRKNPDITLTDIERLR